AQPRIPSRMGSAAYVRPHRHARSEFDHEVASVVPTASLAMADAPVTERSDRALVHLYRIGISTTCRSGFTPRCDVALASVVAAPIFSAACRRQVRDRRGMPFSLIHCRT